MRPWLDVGHYFADVLCFISLSCHRLTHILLFCKASHLRETRWPQVYWLERGWPPIWDAAVQGDTHLHQPLSTMFEALISITIFAGANMLLVWQLKLGTMEQDEAQSEFELRPYINTAKKQRTLGAWIEWMWFGWWPTLQYSDFSLLWPFTVYCNSSINAQGNVSCIVFPNLRLFQWSL